MGGGEKKNLVKGGGANFSRALRAREKNQTFCPFSWRMEGFQSYYSTSKCYFCFNKVGIYNFQFWGPHVDGGGGEIFPGGGGTVTPLISELQ